MQPGLVNVYQLRGIKTCANSTPFLGRAQQAVPLRLIYAINILIFKLISCDCRDRATPYAADAGLRHAVWPLGTSQPMPAAFACRSRRS